MGSEGSTSLQIDVRQQFLVWRIVAASMMIAVGLFAAGGIVLTRLGSFPPSLERRHKPRDGERW